MPCLWSSQTLFNQQYLPTVHLICRWAVLRFVLSTAIGLFKFIFIPRRHLDKVLSGQGFVSQGTFNSSFKTRSLSLCSQRSNVAKIHEWVLAKGFVQGPIESVIGPEGFWGGASFTNNAVNDLCIV